MTTGDDPYPVTSGAAILFNGDISIDLSFARVDSIKLRAVSPESLRQQCSDILGSPEVTFSVEVTIPENFQPTFNPPYLEDFNLQVGVFPKPYISPEAKDIEGDDIIGSI